MPYCTQTPCCRPSNGEETLAIIRSVIKPKVYIRTNKKEPKWGKAKTKLQMQKEELAQSMAEMSGRSGTSGWTVCAWAVLAPQFLPLVLWSGQHKLRGLSDLFWMRSKSGSVLYCLWLVELQLFCVLFCFCSFKSKVYTVPMCNTFGFKGRFS